MAEAQSHRGPDDCGFVRERTPSGWTVALSNRRLAIIDRSPAGHQPMVLDDRLWLTFNGEIYNFIELRAELKSLGRHFRTRSDTEVLLHAYDHWGESCLERLNGMWSFALWDRARRTLFCAVDCSGMKPFHFFHTPGSFAFASEIKALLTQSDMPKKVDREIALLYLVSSVDSYEDRTFFDGIRRLRPGHAMRVTTTNGVAIETWRWWKPKLSDRPSSLEEAGARLNELLRDSIKLRYRSDVPVGISLSGGLDSGGLLCTAADMGAKGLLSLPDGLRTFTAATGDPRTDEAPAAAQLVSGMHATPYSVQPTAAELVADIGRLVAQHDEPFRSLSTYMQFRVMRMARETGTVVILSGQGPDELLWGYPWQYAYVWSDLAASGRLGALARAIVDATLHGTVGMKELMGYAAYAWLPKARLRRYLARVGPFLTDAFKDGDSAIAKRIFKRESGREFFTQEVESLGLPSLLRYEDRNSMSFSVESRLPYLDPRILELAYSLQSWDRIDRGWSKAVLRRALTGVAPLNLVRQRRKLGFAAPEAEFLRALIPALRESFESNSRSDTLLRPKMIVDSVEGGHSPPSHFWRFLNLELWMRAYGLRV
jgi:asparagine synthase (glutamine-hydrolysing)